MKISRLFVRTLFVLLSMFFIAAYMGGKEPSALRIGIGALIGLGYGALLVGLEHLFRKANLRTFNVMVIGLFFGYLLGLVLVLMLKVVVPLSPASDLFGIIKTGLFLLGTYLGVTLAIRSADELSISIPFVKLSRGQEQANDLLLSPSALTDPRLLDLATPGLLDKRLILPRFVLKELYAQCEYPDERIRAQGRKGVETARQLEKLANLDLRITDTDFVEAQDPFAKLVRLARDLDANILTADTTPVQLEGIRTINLHTIAQALKPMAQGSETSVIKIQRYGKEPSQGIGYTEDGAMVVVNGGGDYIGEEIRVRVLSKKQTTAGRIIFCNVDEEEEEPYSYRREHRRDEY